MSVASQTDCRSGVSEHRAGPAIIRDRVFQARDHAVFVGLTLVALVATSGFLSHWVSVAAWRQHRAIMAVASLLVLGSLSMQAFAWWLLPRMRRSRPIAPRTDRSVGVVTTFVPGLESLDMLEETLRALAAMEYRHETWVLDEDDDDQVKTLCRRLGVYHFSRKHMPHYQTAGSFEARAKHGNYNAWLHEVGFHRYEIMAAFDPDHVPDRRYLTSVLGSFEDPNVGYVQVPQLFHNADVNFISGGAAEEAAPFYSCIQLAGDAAGHPIIIGCHNTHRVAALRAMGGFAPHHADDVMLTLLYRSRGWRGVYVPRPLARGLAPVDWPTYLRQQRRWARALVDLKLRVYPRLARSLPLGSRLLGLLHGMSFLRGALSFCGVFLLALYGIACPVDLDLSSRPLLMWSAALLIALLLCEQFQRTFYLDRGGRARVRWRAAVLSYAKWPYVLAGAIEGVLGRRSAYDTTPKTRRAGLAGPALWPHGIAVIAIGVAITTRMSSGGPPSLIPLAAGAILATASAGLLATELLLSFPDPYRPATRPPRGESNGSASPEVLGAARAPADCATTGSVS
jgi:cellulose synthase/poly-beta-1,6-N-acetylglucosamine synthase-like glycosyltransferase